LNRTPIDLRARRKGIFLMLGAGLSWSTGGIIIRNLTLADPWEIVFWRSSFMVIFMLGILLAWHRTRMMKKIIEVGWLGLLAGAFLASTFFFFILSLERNTVANTLVLMSVSPLLVALLGRIILSELLPLRTGVAIAVALLGILIMFYDGLDAGQSLGNFFALGVAIALSLNIIVLRRVGSSVSMAPAVLLAGFFAIAFSLPLAWPLAASPHDLTLLWIMGWLQLGAGCLLMTLAAPYLLAGEIGLLGLLEPVLGTIWVWLGIGERPTNFALIGGGIVIGALLVNALYGMRGSSANQSGI
jgi:drug/metabolite transporter (DMT)-like permease